MGRADYNSRAIRAIFLPDDADYVLLRRLAYDGAFRFCRIMFRNSPDGDGAGW